MAHQLCTRKATHTALNRSARGHRFAAPCAIQPKRRDRPPLNHRRPPRLYPSKSRPACPRGPCGRRGLFFHWPCFEEYLRTKSEQQVEKAVRQASATANQKSHQTVRAASGQRGESSEQNPKASKPESFLCQPRRVPALAIPSISTTFPAPRKSPAWRQPSRIRSHGFAYSTCARP